MNKGNYKDLSIPELITKKKNIKAFYLSLRLISLSIRLLFKEIEKHTFSISTPKNTFKNV